MASKDKSIMFVDDESRILEGLENSLYKQRDKWFMRFINSGAEALEELERRPYDVIISDMQMPGMTGAELLVQTQDLYPEMVRLVLSAHAEFEATLRAVPVAHQFLVKPCPTDKLVETIQRACNLHEMVNSPAIVGAISQTKALPAIPSVYRQLNAALADPDRSITDIAHIIQQDMSLCSEIFRIVNSASFSLRKKVYNIEQAVAYLGINMLKNMVLSIEAFNADEFDSGDDPQLIEDVQKHSFLIGLIAKKVMPGKMESENAFLGGILHDIGELILATHHVSVYRHIHAQAVKHERALYEMERELMEASHGEIGAYLLGHWGVPYSVVESTAYHHCPWEVPHLRFAEVDAVYVADRLVNEVLNAKDPLYKAEPINMEYLEKLSIPERKVNEWRTMAMETVYASGAR